MKLKLLFVLLIVTISNAQTQIGNTIYGAKAGDHSGWCVSLSSDGTIVAIGSIWNWAENIAGHVSVYKNISGTWAQIGNSIVADLSGDSSPYSISLSADGSIIAIGAPDNANNGTHSGHVRIYENISGNWIQIGNDIEGENSGDGCGISVSLSADGSIVAIGANLNDNGNGNGAGHVRVYQNIFSNWVQIGNDIDGEAIFDQSGTSVSLSANGNIIAIGAPLNNNSNGSDSGHVRIYENIAGTWIQIGNDIDGKTIGEQIGYGLSLSADGDIVAISSCKNNVRIYQNISGNWIQVGNDIIGNSINIISNKISISSNGEIIAINTVSNDFSGSVLIYKNISGSWEKINSNLKGIANDFYGSDISLSDDGNIIAIGSTSLNTINSAGSVQVYDLSGILSSDTFVLENFNIYPNPTTDILNIELKENLTLEKVFVYDTAGKLVKETTEKTINVSAFAKGMYNVQVVTNQGKATRKVIVK